MNKIFNQNKPLFITSVFAVILILTSVFFGIKTSSKLQLEKENRELKRKITNYEYQLDSLSSEVFVKTIQVGRYEFIFDQFQQIKKDSLVLDCIRHNTE